VTQPEPVLTDLQMLLQINKAASLGSLDQYDQALAAARRARDLADQIGTAARLGQAHSALGELLLHTGAGTRRWPLYRSCIRA
jgi:hypothetical protein